MLIHIDTENERDIDPWENLALAILKQACLDYIDALRNKKKGHLYMWDERGHHRLTIKVEDMIKDCEEFFGSKWYRQLCSVPGDELAKRIREMEGMDD